MLFRSVLNEPFNNVQPNFTNENKFVLPHKEPLMTCMREEKSFAGENAEWNVGIHFHKNTLVPRKNKIPDPDRIGIFGMRQKKSEIHHLHMRNSLKLGAK